MNSAICLHLLHVYESNVSSFSNSIVDGSGWTWEVQAETHPIYLYEYEIHWPLQSAAQSFSLNYQLLNGKVDIQKEIALRGKENQIRLQWYPHGG